MCNALFSGTQAIRERRQQLRFCTFFLSDARIAQSRRCSSGGKCWCFVKRDTWNFYLWRHSSQLETLLPLLLSDLNPGVWGRRDTTNHTVCVGAGCGLLCRVPSKLRRSEAGTFLKNQAFWCGKRRICSHTANMWNPVVSLVVGTLRGGLAACHTGSLWCVFEF